MTITVVFLSGEERKVHAISDYLLEGDSLRLTHTAYGLNVKGFINGVKEVLDEKGIKKSYRQDSRRW